MALQPFGPLPLFFSSVILYTVGETPWTGDQPVSRSLLTHKTTQTQNKRTQTYIPRVGFEHTTPVFEPAKKVHTLDGAATVIGSDTMLVLLITEN
jgi:mannose-6-phosphate isomerase class I